MSKKRKPTQLKFKSLKFQLSWTATIIIGSIGTTQASVQKYFYQEMIHKIQEKENTPTQLHTLVPTQAPFIGEVKNLTLDPNCSSSDNGCGGTMDLGGVIVTIPRNLLIDLPANRLTLKQIFQQARPTCLASDQSGLAQSDTCKITNKGAYATVNANHDSCGKTIAGDIFIANGQ